MADDKPSSSPSQRPYSLFGRPFRLQLSRRAEAGFTGLASRGRCQAEGCPRFEWRTGARYCRDCWLRVYQQTELPDRLV